MKINLRNEEIEVLQQMSNKSSRTKEKKIQNEEGLFKKTKPEGF